MPPNEVSQFIDGGLRVIDLFTKAGKDLARFVIEKMDQNVIFIFKVKIDGPIGDTGGPCNLRYGRFVETGLREYRDCRFQDPVIFIIFGFGSDGLPLGWRPNPYMNEYSFIYQEPSDPVKPKSIRDRNTQKSAH